MTLGNNYSFFVVVKENFYWCKALGSVNLEQGIKKIIKTTTEIKTDESNLTADVKEHSYRRNLWDFSKSAGNRTIRSIILQLITTEIKIKTNKDLQKKGRALQRSKGSPKKDINSIWKLLFFVSVLISIYNQALAIMSVVLIIEVQFAFAQAKPWQQ